MHLEGFCSGKITKEFQRKLLKFLSGGGKYVLAKEGLTGTLIQLDRLCDVCHSLPLIITCSEVVQQLSRYWANLIRLQIYSMKIFRANLAVSVTENFSEC